MIWRGLRTHIASEAIRLEEFQEVAWMIPGFRLDTAGPGRAGTAVYLEVSLLVSRVCNGLVREAVLHLNWATETDGHCHIMCTFAIYIQGQNQSVLLTRVCSAVKSVSALMSLLLPPPP